jgi:hypothetical protein
MKQKLLATASIVVILGALYFMDRQLHPPLSASTAGVFSAMGTAIAQHAVELTAGRGRILVWRPQFKTPSHRLDAVLAGFNATVQQTSSLSVAGEMHDFIPRDGQSAGEDTSPVPAARLIELLNSQPPVDLVVLFGGVPALAGLDVSRLPQPRPKVLIVSLGVTLDGVLVPADIFKNQVVSAVFMPRNTPPENSNPRTDAERIAAAFMYVTPETSSQLVRPPSLPVPPQ